ncbi:MAG: M56 family metallopeptidase [Actinomycetota bacterium]|nr:M56 family metallopeptidase [Actinomycetota bacterium]
MIAGMLAAFAVVLAVALGPILVGRTWVEERPGLGLFAWHMTMATVLASAAAGALIAAHDVWEPLAVFGFRADAELLHHQYTGTSSANHGWNLVLLVVVACIVRLGWSLLSQYRDRRRDAAMLRSGITGIAQQGSFGSPIDVTYVDLAEATAFCIPGKRPLIVVSRLAASTLSARELQAVVAHEREHLRSRHASRLAFAQGLTRAFPAWGLARKYRDAVTLLHEMQADDAAAASTDDRTVVSALLALSGPSSGARPAMAAGSAAIRGRRLLERRRRGTPIARLSAAIILTTALIPAVIAVGPGIGIANSGHSMDGRAEVVAPQHP